MSVTITIGRLHLAIAVVAVVLVAPTAAVAFHIFDDVPDDRFYSDAVEWALANDITTGTSSTTFEPDDAVTRGESVTFLSRYDTNVVRPALVDRITHGEIVLAHGTSQLTPNFDVPTSVRNTSADAVVEGEGVAMLALTGPAVIGGVGYALESIEYCIGVFEPGGFIDRVEVWISEVGDDAGFDETDRASTGCYTADAPHIDPDASGFGVAFTVGGTGPVRIFGVRSTWAPTE